MRCDAVGALYFWQVQAEGEFHRQTFNRTETVIPAAAAAVVVVGRKICLLFAPVYDDCEVDEVAGNAD